MKVGITNNNHFCYITNHSDECSNDTAFLVTQLSKKYLSFAKEKTEHIVYAKDLYKHIPIDIKVIGITGTNGKSTTACMISFLLNALGYKSATLGTMGFFVENKLIEKTNNTTPDTLELYNYLLKAMALDCKFFVMEVSSHSISQDRIAGINFETKIHTNITQDHLEFHKSIQNYRDIKNSFLKNAKNIIINSDDEYVNVSSEYIKYAIDNEADIKASNLVLDENGISANIIYKNESALLKSRLLGKFNLSNILASIGAVKLSTNAGLEEICKEAFSFTNIDGRMQIVNKNPLIIVDFAHTPDGMQKVFDVFKGKKISVVFGAGGNRDKSKRALMGKMADLYASKIYITNDNPRYEDEKEIIKDILEEIDEKEIQIIYDRREAIQKAIRDIKKYKGDVLLILGKGSELYQEKNGIKVPFNDTKIIRKELYP